MVLIVGLVVGALTPLVLPAAAESAPSGEVWAWGDNTYGTLGDGTRTSSATPVKVQGLLNAVQVEGGGVAAYALLANGSVWAWGDNRLGQLGNGTTLDSPLPVDTGLTNVKSIAAYGNTAFALKNDGSVWAWGSNAYAELGDGGVGRNASTPTRISALAGLTITAITAGGNNGYALQSDGTLWSWGNAQFGALGQGATAVTRRPPGKVPLANVVSVSGSGAGAYAATSDGRTWAWGIYNPPGDGTNAVNTNLAPVQVPGLTGIVKVIGGSGTAFAIDAAGRTWVWGANSRGDLGIGTTSNVLTPVVAAGFNNQTSLAPSTSDSSSSVVSFTDGSVSTWGYYAPSLTPVAGLSGVTSVGASSLSAYAIGTYTPNPSPTPTTPTPTTTAPADQPVDTVPSPWVKVTVKGSGGSTDDLWTAVVTSCPNGLSPTLRIGTPTQNYALPASLSEGSYTNNSLPVVLVPGGGVSGGKTTITFRTTLTGDLHVYPYCGATQAAAGAFHVGASAFVGLGDSYSSGEGANPGDFIKGTNFKGVGCHRSETAWPLLTAKSLGFGGDVAFAACSGGVIADLYRNNTRWLPYTGVELPQIQHVQGSATRKVTLTVGGNDVGFEKILTACVSGAGAPGSHGCRNKALPDNPEVMLAEFVEGNLRNLQTGVPFDLREADGVIRPQTKTLADVYVDIASRMAQGGQLVVAGYPAFFGSDTKYYTKTGNGGRPGIPVQYNCRVHTGFDVAYDDATWINGLARQGNDVIRLEIRKALVRLASTRPDVSVLYADADFAWNDHRLCDKKDHRLNGLQLAGSGSGLPAADGNIVGAKRQSFHPDHDGQKKAYRKAALDPVVG